MSEKETTLTPLGTVLVANRGEIAARVLRTAHSLGYRTVAVYSEADAAAPWLALADDVQPIGPAPAAESYLCAESILAAARASGARAVHPGYGFLAEDPDFARACEDAGLVFIGPPPAAIARMGNKAEAKRLMIEAGVPCVPGFQGEQPSDDELLAGAADVGFPLLVKAAAGGGGRGMRLVRRAEDLPAALAQARSEAKSAFGSDELILERAIQNARHVEMQVFADTHGEVIHLGERDCSVQRRHQKVLEESPCPVLTSALRERMGTAAVEAARAIGYVGAGTVEFLLEMPDGDPEQASFYFLEMNTRLQVEHPVTELVTGLDLVELQLRVAEGRPLGLRQEEIELRGHAIEARLYAEDPEQDFLPASGEILLWRPGRGAGLRVDDGVRTGSVVSPFYDPMVAKVIAWAPTRDQARRRLVAGLRRTGLFGPPNNRDFLLTCLANTTFADGRATTAFLDDELGSDGFRRPESSAEHYAAAAVLQFLDARDRHHRSTLAVSPTLLDWSSGNPLGSSFRYGLGGENAEGVVDAHVTPATSPGHYEVAVTVPPAGDEEAPGPRTVSVRVLTRDRPDAALVLDGRRVELLAFCESETVLHLALDDTTLRLTNLLGLPPGSEEEGGGGRIVAPMHGTVLEICVAEGEHVTAGTRIAVIEAMKMQHELEAEIDGTVTRVAQTAGAQVAGGDLLVELEPDETAEAAS